MFDETTVTDPHETNATPRADPCRPELDALEDTWARLAARVGDPTQAEYDAFDGAVAAVTGCGAGAGRNVVELVALLEGSHATLGGPDRLRARAVRVAYEVYYTMRAR